jgi:hypothetical protein
LEYERAVLLDLENPTGMFRRMRQTIQRISAGDAVALLTTGEGAP